MKPGLPALALLFTLEGLAQGPEERILGRGDAAFARELYRAGYVDLAKGVCAAIEKAGKASPAERIEVRALYLDLQLDAAKEEADPRKRKDLVAAVLRGKQEFIAANPGSREAQEAEDNLSDVYRLLGEVLTAVLQKEQDPAAAAKLRKEGEETFTRAADVLKQQVAKLKELRDDPAAELRYMNACYSLPRTYYYHSLIYAPGDIKKERLLEEAVASFREFGLDYGDRMLNFEGLVYQGLCHRELGKPEEALADFDDAIRLRQTYEQNEAGLFSLSSDAADVVSAAVLQKVLLLKDQGKFAEAIEAAKDYLGTTADPLAAGRGLAVLAAEADCELASGDLTGAGATADRLVAADPNGVWGRYGRELQGRMLGGGGSSSGADPAKLIRVAEAMVEGGDADRALEICGEALRLARGSPQEASLGSEAFLLIGALYARRGWLHEASVAFDAAAERYPTGEMAPEGLWKAVLCYLRLNGQEKRPFYKRRVEDRMARLARNYPNHPNAGYAQVVEAKQLEEDQEYLKAAALYEKVAPGSSSYEDALLGAGNCHFQHALQLLQEKKAGEAKPFFDQAEARLRKAAAEAEAAAEKTMDRDAQRRLGDVGYRALGTLSNLFLQDGSKREGEVLALLKGADERFADDPAKLASLWGLRIQALQAQGKFGEAIDLLESLLQKNPDPRQVAAASGVLARSLDQRGQDLREKDPKSSEADDLWRKAARYYEASVRAQLKGEEPSNASLLDGVGTRLFVFGLHFNGVPEDQEEFVGWESSVPRAPEFWEQAGKMYEAALTTSVSYKTMISLGRTHGYLGRWREAATVLARLFDQESLLNPDKTRIQNAALAAKPELLPAYLEWGVAEFQVAADEKDQERLARALHIFEVLASSTGGESRRWWHAKYYQIQCLLAQGEYKRADVAVRSVERTTEDFDQGKFGYKAKFLQLKSELAKKVLR
ncbi:MAG TPA: hypothetical protein VFI25_02115 [Planctomycetota bacterium]|jgi:hypothetical protein|nr:hypothetical protein [Planctomycetota bacterium]